MRRLTQEDFLPDILQKSFLLYHCVIIADSEFLEEYEKAVHRYLHPVAYADLVFSIKELEISIYKNKHRFEDAVNYIRKVMGDYYTISFGEYCWKK